jgi:hypothetical protein
MNVEIGRQNIIILFGNNEAAKFHFWEYINRNQTCMLDSYWPYICSVWGFVQYSTQISIRISRKWQSHISLRNDDARISHTSNTHFQHFLLQWEGLADESIQVIRDKTEFDKSLVIIPLPILCSSY